MNANVADVSGFRLLRQYTDEEPEMLTNAVMNAMNAGGVVWREPASSDDKVAGTDRWSNLDFLRNEKARSAWKGCWPSDKCRFSWDAIGRVQIGKVGWEWLLVTASARPGELEQNLEPSLGEVDERVVLSMKQSGNTELNRLSIGLTATSIWLPGCQR